MSTFGRRVTKVEMRQWVRSDESAWGAVGGGQIRDCESSARGAQVTFTPGLVAVRDLLDARIPVASVRNVRGEGEQHVDWRVRQRLGEERPRRRRCKHADG